jgi:hypothetical protein
MKRVSALLTIGSLMACSVRRPEQENFLVDASRIGGASLAHELSLGLGATLTQAELSLPNSDKAQIFRLDGNGFMLILTPLPDDRCNPNASFQSTYNEKKYRADLVFESSSKDQRNTSRKKLLAIGHELKVPISKFEECPKLQP